MRIFDSPFALHVLTNKMYYCIRIMFLYPYGYMICLSHPLSGRHVHLPWVQDLLVTVFRGRREHKDGQCCSSHCKSEDEGVGQQSLER